MRTASTPQTRSSGITTSTPSSKAKKSLRSGRHDGPAGQGYAGRDRSDRLRPRQGGRQAGPEPPFRRAAPTTPADRAGVRVDCFPAHTAFPKWQDGRHPTFEACSGFTRVTARRIAQPPKATFVTRLQPYRLPGRAARQLPGSNTTERLSAGCSRKKRSISLAASGPRGSV
jgi:hypothetical protein